MQISCCTQQPGSTKAGLSITKL